MTDTLSPTSTPLVPVSFDDLVKVFSLAAPRLEWFPYPQHDLTFSCSTNGVWPVTRWGVVPMEERVDVHRESWLLELVATLMRSTVSPRGGRFVITLDGALRATDRLPICRFEVGA